MCVYEIITVKGGGGELSLEVHTHVGRINSVYRESEAKKGTVKGRKAKGENSRVKTVRVRV